MGSYILILTDNPNNLGKQVLPLTPVSVPKLEAPSLLGVADLGIVHHAVKLVVASAPDYFDPQVGLGSIQ